MATPIVTARILRRLLNGGAYARAERLLTRIHPADLGPVLSDLTPDETRTVIDLLFRQRRAASTLKELPPELLPQVFDAVTDERLAGVLARVEQPVQRLGGGAAVPPAQRVHQVEDDGGLGVGHHLVHVRRRDGPLGGRIGHQLDDLLVEQP